MQKKQQPTNQLDASKLLNQRTELVTKCRHLNKFVLRHLRIDEFA